jgi:hypothetical protein
MASLCQVRDLDPGLRSQDPRSQKVVPCGRSPLKVRNKLEVLAHTCNTSTWEIGTGGQPELHSELQANLGYIQSETLSQKHKMQTNQKVKIERGREQEKWLNS